MDSAGLPPKTGNRATPSVLESKTFKDGAIYLYRRAEYKKPTWYIRLKIPGAKGYVWKSSGSTDEYVAYKVAEDLITNRPLDPLQRHRASKLGCGGGCL